MVRLFNKWYEVHPKRVSNPDYVDFRIMASADIAFNTETKRVLKDRLGDFSIGRMDLIKLKNWNAGNKNFPEVNSNNIKYIIRDGWQG